MVPIQPVAAQRFSIVGSEVNGFRDKNTQGLSDAARRYGAQAGLVLNQMGLLRTDFVCDINLVFYFLYFVLLLSIIYIYISFS